MLLIGLVIERADVLQVTVRQLLYVLFAGSFLIHFMPGALRLDAFVGLSLAVVVWVLGLVPSEGWSFAVGSSRAAVLVAAGLVLIGICRLPYGFWARAGMLLVAGAVVALLRRGLVTPGQEIVWLVLSSMFMFRVIVYLYDVSTMKNLPGWRITLAYFFMAPNVAVPNFPIVDFKTFQASHLRQEPVVASQGGVNRIARGLVHLVLLRLVEQVHVSPEAVYSGKTLALYLLTNMSVYLGVSGSLHIVTGVLQLLGFDLPRTHIRYFLAQSFSDYWRRANTYWRGFLLKVFFYPVFFRLRPVGNVAAVGLATALVFFMSWAFHVYPTWWMWGYLHITWPDSLFWATLGGLVILNTFWEMKAPQDHAGLGGVLHSLLGTALTFATVSIAWSMLTSPSIEQWRRLWSHADVFTLAAAGGTLSVIMAAKWLLELRPGHSRSVGNQRRYRWFGSVVSNMVPLGLVAGLTWVPSGTRHTEFGLGSVDPSLSSKRLFDALEDGDSLPRQTFGPERLDEGWRQLMEVLTLRPIQPTLPDPLPVTPVTDYRLYVLPAGMDAETQFEASLFSTNADGDRDVTPVEEAAAHAVFLGGSTVMGWGIDDGNTFADLVDESLGADLDVSNLGVHGFSLLSQVSVLAERGSALAPELVVVFGDAVDLRLSSYSLHETLRRTGRVPDAELAGMLERARVEPRTRPRLAEKRLGPHEHDIVRWSLRRVATQARELGARPVFVALPTASRLAADLDEDAVSRDLLRAAGDAGMQTINLSGILKGHDPATTIAGRVPHLSAGAHTLIAAALVDHLRAELTAADQGAAQ